MILQSHPARCSADERPAHNGREVGSTPTGPICTPDYQGVFVYKETKMSDEVEEVKKNLRTKKKEVKFTKTDYLSTGSTLLNLELCGKPRGGLIKGKYYLMVGDSASGKTFLALTMLAEAGINKSFDDYRFVYNNVEDGALMDIGKFFGPAVANRIETKASSTVEEFYYDLDDVAREGKPFIYVLDSMDALRTEDDEEQFEKRKKAHQAGKKEVTGSYGTAKAKANSQGIRVVTEGLARTGSILIIISQTRDNIGFGSQYNPKTRSGGKSLRFYATNELWFSIREKLTKRVKGKDRHIGTLCRIHIKKNRQSGRESQIDLPIYHSVGVDDLGSMVDYLVDEGLWKDDKGNKITAPEFEFSGKKEDLIKKIEDEGTEGQLIAVVTDLWKQIEEESRVQRKPKYG